MSTTLTNGLKLPDKGSVDWYADMQSNYTILDGAVGTVAEHTSQIAGKAPAVHTHGKADITDLFNSANTWGALNSYNQSIQITANFNIGAAPSSDVYGGFNFGNGTINIGNVTARINNAGATYSRLYIGNKFTNGALDPNGTWKYVELQVGLRANGDRFIYTDGSWRNSLIPYDSTVSIGDSTHQWNNLYAQTYYYNGTAWGLDKANEWTGSNTFSSATNSVLYFKSGTSGSYSDIRWKDNNGSHYATLRGRVTDLSLGLQYSSASAWYNGASITISNNGNVQIKAYDGTESWTVNFTPVGVYPTSNNALELGTSTAKWKTLNGINPGVLSIFNPLATQDPIDVPNTWVTDGSAWNTLNVSNMGDGWICLTYMLCGANDYILARFGSSSAAYPSMIFPAIMLSTSRYFLYMLVPVAKAMGNIYLEINLDSNAILVAHCFIPSYGTV